MRKLIIFLIFLIIIFVLNVIFYFLSNDYRFFLKKIKSPNEVVYLEEKKYNDDIIDDNIKYIDSNIVDNKEEDLVETIELDKKNEITFEIKNDPDKIELKKQISL
jgi:uncharacterized protein (UPF0333 family)